MSLRLCEGSRSIAAECVINEDRGQACQDIQVCMYVCMYSNRWAKLALHLVQVHPQLPSSDTGLFLSYC